MANLYTHCRRLQACTGTNLLLPLGEVVHNIGIQAAGNGASFGS